VKIASNRVDLYRGLYWANQGLLNAVHALHDVEAPVSSDSSRPLNHELRRTQAIYRERTLWSTAHPSRIQVLLARMDHSDRGNALLAGARRTTTVVRNIEERLTDKAAYYLEQQLDENHATGDPVWRAGMGFGRAQQAASVENGSHFNVYLRKRGKIVKVGSTYYINLRIASKRDPKLVRLLVQIGPCWSAHKDEQ
jgi:hypothetical protein